MPELNFLPENCVRSLKSKSNGNHYSIAEVETNIFLNKIVKRANMTGPVNIGHVSI